MGRRISVIGLGKLGLPLAALCAERGHEVAGIDLAEDAVASINRGEAPIYEPGLQALIEAAGGRLRASTSFDHGASSELTFIVVPTPSLEDGTFSNEYVLQAVRSVGAAHAGNDQFHTVVIVSTVMPGSMSREIAPALEDASRRRVGEDIGLCYSPEFIALGEVIKGMTEPDQVLIGESDERAGDLLVDVYNTLHSTEPELFRTNFVNAELSKLTTNAFVTMKISFANSVGELAESLPGADAAQVLSAVGADPRIGRRYLQPALGYGGPCFPRDIVALATLASQAGAPDDLAAATRAVNDGQVPRLAAKVVALTPDGGRAGILGLAYKPNTDITEESQGLHLADALSAAGVDVTVFDEAAMDSARAELGDRVTYAQSAAECAASADVLVVATAWPSFAQLGASDLKPGDPPPVVIDCWRMLDQAAFGDRARWLHLGSGDHAVEHGLVE